MAVTVGTDVFASIADADAFFTKRGYTDWLALGTPAKEVLLVNASDYLERTYRWRGEKSDPAQRLGWPDRECAYDDEENLLTGTPWQVVEAMCLVAEQLRLGVDLTGVLTDSASVVREKVDVIEIEYDPSSRVRGPAVLSHVMNLLRGVTLGPSLLRA